MQEFDLIVLGAGNSFDVIRAAASAGWNLAIVEKGPLGGTCPNRGCIPSKLFLAHADVAHAVRRAGEFHVRATLDGIDRDAIMRDVKSYIDGFDEQIEDGLADNVTLFRGHGRFVEERVLQVGEARITAPKIVISTGSRPRRPQLDVPVWTSDEVFTRETAPSTITIVGGGFIGAELGHFFHGIGVDTLLVARDDKLIAPEDEEVRAVFQEAFTARVPTAFGTEVAAVEHDGTSYRITLKGPDGAETVRESEALLYSIGRVPNSDGIGLEHAGVETDGRGYVKVDDHLQTNVAGIYALGDVAGGPFFTHAASYAAAYLGRQLVDGEDAPLDYGPMPHAVFTEPEIAGVGKTEQELRAEGVDFVKGVQKYENVTKGRAIKERHGLAKFLLDRDGKILGFHATGAHASILVHEVIPVMRWRNHVSSVTDMIHVHPSLPEVVQGAAKNAAQQLP